ncbi:hypothetical protein BV22DRAFT_1134466 [Leucogyrophana mollusca]|uniref:Uncharacterized protein n=1 Tax=Leucogyrophana mollusca TaxID=85980 RepID=A0ACB8AYV6_9AGAM|nr:hypothetical protein BV22DRAFT_1134466 [Leucogyrophana mollusca]
MTMLIDTIFKPITAELLRTLTIFTSTDWARILLGDGYVFSLYVNERLKEVKDKVAKNTSVRVVAPDSAGATKRHEDAMYTIMALIPTLSEQIAEELDVGGLTHEHQSSESCAAIICTSSSPPFPARTELPSVRCMFWREWEPWTREWEVVARGAQLSNSITTASSQMSHTSSAVASSHSEVPSTYPAASALPYSTHNNSPLLHDPHLSSYLHPARPPRATAPSVPDSSATITYVYSNQTRGEPPVGYANAGGPFGWVERVHGALPALPTFISKEDDFLDDSDLTHKTNAPRTGHLQLTTIWDDT